MLIRIEKHVEPNSVDDLVEVLTKIESGKCVYAKMGRLKKIPKIKFYESSYRVRLDLLIASLFTVKIFLLNFYKFLVLQMAKKQRKSRMDRKIVQRSKVHQSLPFNSIKRKIVYPRIGQR